MRRERDGRPAPREGVDQEPIRARSARPRAEPRPTAPTAGAALRARLHRPGALREATLLQIILGLPQGLREDDAG